MYRFSIASWKNLKLSSNTLSSEFESIARYAKTSTPLKEEQKEKTQHLLYLKIKVKMH